MDLVKPALCILACIADEFISVYRLRPRQSKLAVVRCLKISVVALSFSPQFRIGFFSLPIGLHDFPNSLAVRGAWDEQPELFGVRHSGLVHRSLSRSLQGSGAN